MMYICSECGSQIPEDSDFCYHCGALRTKALQMDDSGHMEMGKCYSCGEPVKGEEYFCSKCGAPLVKATQPHLVKYGMLAIFMAAIPGFFNIFGLGHLVLKQWSRGIMFMVMGALLWWIEPGYMMSGDLFIMMLRIGVFFYQMMDIYRYALDMGGR